MSNKEKKLTWYDNDKLEWMYIQATGYNALLNKCTLEEFYLYLLRFRPFVTRDEVNKMLNTIASNGTKEIDLELFKKLMHPTMLRRYEEFRDDFNYFDKNRDGFITLDEIKEGFKKMGRKLTDEQAKKMLRAADLDRDGRVGFSEFSRIMDLYK